MTIAVLAVFTREWSESAMYQQEELSIKYEAPKSIVVVVVAECLGTNHWPRARWRAEMVPESRAGIVCIELYSTLCNHTWHLRPIIHSAGTTLTSSLFEGPRDLWSWWHHGHGCWNSCSIPLWSCGWSLHLFLWCVDTGHNAIPWIMTGILHQTQNKFNHLWLMANATEAPVFISTSNDF